MGVDFLLVLCFDDENDLDRDKVVRIVAVGEDQLRSSIDGKLGGVLEARVSATMSLGKLL